MRSDDEKWIDALAGHDAPASADEARMQQAVRKAAASMEATQGEADMLAERRLLQRLEREGLLARSRAQRWRPLRLAQAAVIVLCVGLSVELIRVEPTRQLAQDAEPLKPVADVADMAAAPAQFALPEPSSARAMAEARAAKQAAQAVKAAPPAASASAPLRDQAAGLSTPSQSRESVARAAPPPDIRVPVADLKNAWRELQHVLDSNTGLTEISRDALRDRISLRCVVQSGCDSLRDWLHSLDDTLPEPQVGEVMHLRLEPRS